MKLKHFLFLVLLMVVSVAKAQMEMPPVPVDPEVRTGKLDNGLTYFIRHNNWPEHPEGWLYSGRRKPARSGPLPRAHGFQRF